MPKPFDFARLKSFGKASPISNVRFWFVAGGGVLLIANLAMLFLVLFPPGGSEAQLVSQREQLQTEIRLAKAGTTRLRNVSGKVESGSQQATEFEKQYFLQERLAYSAIMAEIQRMAKETSVEEREAVYSKEPIEGSDDLSILNAGVRFRGSYANLMRFLNEADKSPLLLMIDTVRAT